MSPLPGSAVYPSFSPLCIFMMSFLGFISYMLIHKYFSAYGKHKNRLELCSCIHCLSFNLICQVRSQAGGYFERCLFYSSYAWRLCAFLVYCDQISTESGCFVRLRMIQRSPRRSGGRIRIACMCVAWAIAVFSIIVYLLVGDFSWGRIQGRAPVFLVLSQFSYLKTIVRGTLLNPGHTIISINPTDHAPLPTSQSKVETFFVETGLQPLFDLERLGVEILTVLAANN